MTGDSFVVLPRLDPDIHAVAEHIGWIVLRAAEADAALTVLAGPEGSVLKAWSLTGEPLGKAVTNAGYPELAKRYEALYKVRNQIVHSIYHLTDAEPDVFGRRWSGVSLRAERLRKGVPAAEHTPEELRSLMLFEVKEMPSGQLVVPALAKVAQEFTTLTYDARKRWLIDVFGDTVEDATTALQDQG